MTTFSPTDVIERAFQIYKEQAGVLLPPAAVIFAVAAIASHFLDSPALFILAGAVGTVVAIFYSGMVVRLVDDVRDGIRDSTAADLFKSVAPVALPLFLLAVVVSVCVTIGFILLIVPGLFLLTIWAVAAPVVVLEGGGVFDAMERSRALVRGNGWNVFGVIVIVFLLQVIVGMVAGAIGEAGGHLVSTLAQWVTNVVVAPLAALTTAVLYFTLRDVR
jgi:hypothetical protein